MHMNYLDFTENKFEIYDPIKIHFECLSSCDVKDNTCIFSCEGKTKKFKNLIF